MTDFKPEGRDCITRDGQLAKWVKDREWEVFDPDPYPLMFEIDGNIYFFTRSGRYYVGDGVESVLDLVRYADEPEKPEKPEKPARKRYTIKRLPWQTNSHDSIWTGELAFGGHYVIEDTGQFFRVTRGRSLSAYGPTLVGDFATMRDAKAAAQRDFEAELSGVLSRVRP